MLNQIKGLHHVTSMAKDARENNEFFTGKLGLRRVKKTVNFDAPDVYHLYYADEFGTPGSVMTYFPFPNIGKGRPGVGEVGTTVFSVPEGTLGYWKERFEKEGVTGLKRETELRREPPAFRRSRRRRFCARRGQGRRARALVEGRRAGRRGDPRLPFGVAQAAGRRRHRGAAEVHGLRECRPVRQREASRHQGRQRRRHHRHRDAARRRLRRSRRRLGAPHRLRGRKPRQAARSAQGADRHRLPGHAGHRPRLFLGDLFPHAGRRAVRGRDQRARLRPRRGHGPSRRGAEAARPSTRICAIIWKSICSRSATSILQWDHLACTNAGGKTGLPTFPRSCLRRRRCRPDSYIHKVLPGSPGGPLLFTFHGTGGDESQFLGLARELLPAATIVSPRGDVSEYGAARFFRRTGEGVYDMDDLARATDKMAAFVRAHVEAAKALGGARARLFERREHPRLGDVRRAGAVRRGCADAPADPVRA